MHIKKGEELEIFKLLAQRGVVEFVEEPLLLSPPSDRSSGLESVRLRYSPALGFERLQISTLLILVKISDGG